MSELQTVNKTFVKVDLLFFKIEYTVGSVILGLPSSVAVFLKDAQQQNSQFSEGDDQ